MYRGNGCSVLLEYGTVSVVKLLLMSEQSKMFLNYINPHDGDSKLLRNTNFHQLTPLHMQDDLSVITAVRASNYASIKSLIMNN